MHNRPHKCDVWKAVLPHKRNLNMLKETFIVLLDILGPFNTVIVSIVIAFIVSVFHREEDCSIKKENTSPCCIETC